MIKSLFWKIAHVCHPYLRDFLLFTKIMNHSGRQEFYVGMLDSDINNFKSILEKNGFEHCALAWIDDDEVFGMRKKEGKYQYHIRLYSDGEVRGHYEYAPESKPLAHFKAKYFVNKKEYFLEFLSSVLS